MKKINNEALFKKRVGNICFGIIRFIIIFGIGFIILKPIISKFLMSFMSQNDLLDNTVKLIPREWSLHFWNEALSQMHLPKSLINTLLLSLVIATIQTAVSISVGYGLARFKFRGNKVAFAFVIIMLLVPYQVISIAQYSSFAQIHIGSYYIVDSFIPLCILALMCLGVREGLYIYLMRETFAALPATLEEAAYIDGAGVFKTFVSVMLPNSKTMMTTVFLFSFCWQWTDSTTSALYLIDTRVLANSLTSIFIEQGNHGDAMSTFVAKCAGSIFVSIPLIALFVLCQRSFVKSISQAGLSST